LDSECSVCWSIIVRNILDGSNTVVNWDAPYRDSSWAFVGRIDRPEDYLWAVDTAKGCLSSSSIVLPFQKEKGRERSFQ
jgi:hypothetical protein